VWQSPLGTVQILLRPGWSNPCDDRSSGASRAAQTISGTTITVGITIGLTIGSHCYNDPLLCRLPAVYEKQGRQTRSCGRVLKAFFVHSRARGTCNNEVVNTPASYSVCSGFKSQLGDQFLWLLWFSSANPFTRRHYTRRHNRRLPDPYQFVSRRRTIWATRSFRN
jgi:hypothetical protein